MRPWLALKWGGISFEEHVIQLGVEGYGQSAIKEVRDVSPSGRVPALHLDGVVIHESLAICEWAAEHAPSLWPKEVLARAQARALASEMHAGFFALRRDLSMNVRRRLAQEPSWPEDTRIDLAQLFTTWTHALEKSGGPFLFGARSIADAMFAPVATRLRTYKVSAPAPVRAYCDAIFADTAFKEWERAAEVEPWTIQSAEDLYR